MSALPERIETEDYIKQGNIYVVKKLSKSIFDDALKSFEKSNEKEKKPLLFSMALPLIPMALEYFAEKKHDLITLMREKNITVVIETEGNYLSINGYGGEDNKLIFSINM